MSSRVEFHWENLNPILKGASDDLKQIGRDLAKDMRKTAPKRSGRLKRAVSTNYTGSRLDRTSSQKQRDKVGKPDGKQLIIKNGRLSGGPFKVVVGVGKGVWYSRYTEYGTSKMAATPWLRPVFEKWKKKMEAGFKKHGT